jgi:hypothetical protein
MLTGIHLAKWRDKNNKVLINNSGLRNSDGHGMHSARKVLLKVSSYQKKIIQLFSLLMKSQLEIFSNKRNDIALFLFFSEESEC